MIDKFGFFYLPDDVVKEMFSVFDKDGGGCISVEELRKAIMDIDETFSEDDVQELFREVDADGSGYINKEEFALMTSKFNKF